ncbi:MAG: triose-phosphate isomerase [Pseudomonadales bacterium]
MRKPLVIGNWKMNGSAARNDALLTALTASDVQLPKVDIVVCPPFVYIQQVATLANECTLAWGAQNCAAKTDGAYTGEVSAAMLHDMGCSYAIIGHSERRALFADDDATVAQKFARLSEQGVRPVLCVGETLAQREAEETLAVIDEQLDAVLTTNSVEQCRDAVLAYEPVWAIGTGKTATPEQAQEVHAFIRQRLAQYDTSLAQKTRILYGGSVKAGNAAELFGQQDIDGGLIGGASLVAEDFLAICKAASE